MMHMISRLLLRRFAGERFLRALRFGLLALAAMCFAQPCAAQIRVVNYNIAQLAGNTGNLQDVFAALQADDKAGFATPVGVFVFQEVLTTNVASLQAMINATAPLGVTYALGTFTSASEDDFAGAQAMFYRSDLLSEVTSAHVDLYTGAGRRCDRWKLQLVGYTAAASSFYVYSAHLKSSTGFEAERLTGAQTMRTNADALGANQNVIFAGDWNIYNNSEPAYLHMLSAGNAQMTDPLGSGSWAGTGNALKHTQSPRLPNGTLVGGGMDDRFDFQLSTAPMHDGLGLSLMSGSWVYRGLGNDGAHYNNSINAGTNSYYVGNRTRSNALAADLYDASDHIPVVVEYQIPAKMAGVLAANFGRVIQGATHNLSLTVTNPAPVVTPLGGDALDYAATGSLALSGVQTGSVEPLGDSDALSFAMNTSTVGSTTARVSLTSTSQAVQPASLTLDSVGTIVRHANGSFASASDVNATTAAAQFAPDTGAHVVAVPIHNFGFNSLQALLDIDGVSSLSSPFAFMNGLTTGVGSTPATLNFAFDTDGRLPGLYSTQATINLSDENLPGAANSMLTLTLDITVTGAIACAADVNGDTQVNVTDLLAVITAWGACPIPPNACSADINHDSIVNVTDLLAVITAWGACP